MHISPSNLTFPLCICLELPKLRTAKSRVLFTSYGAITQCSYRRRFRGCTLAILIVFVNHAPLSQCNTYSHSICDMSFHKLFSCPNVLFPFVAIPDQTETQMV